MEINAFMLASYAEVYDDGKTFVIGGDLDHLRIQGKLPTATATPLYLLVKLRLRPEECSREYQYRIEFLAPDGSLVDASEKAFAPPAPPPNRWAKVGFVLMFLGVTFPVAGEYTIRLLMDGKEVRRLPFYVEEATPAQQEHNR